MAGTLELIGWNKADGTPKAAATFRVGTGAKSMPSVMAWKGITSSPQWKVMPM